MSWRRTAGVLAVLLVIGTAVGVVATLLTANDLLLGSTEQVPAIASLGVVIVGLAVAVLLGGPSKEWLGNPYW